MNRKPTQASYLSKCVYKPLVQFFAAREMNQVREILA
jgi:hypothetical protein